MAAFKLGGGAQVYRSSQGWAICVNLDDCAGGDDFLVLFSSQARALAEDLLCAADEAETEIHREEMQDGIDSGDLDRNGDPIPYPRYRAA